MTHVDCTLITLQFCYLLDPLPFRVLFFVYCRCARRICCCTRLLHVTFAYSAFTFLVVLGLGYHSSPLPVTLHTPPHYCLGCGLLRAHLPLPPLRYTAAAASCTPRYLTFLPCIVLHTVHYMDWNTLFYNYKLPVLLLLLPQLYCCS